MSFDLKTVAALMIGTAAIVWGWFEIFATQEQVAIQDQAVVEIITQQLVPLKKSAQRSARRADAETLGDVIAACNADPQPEWKSRVQLLKADFLENYGVEYMGSCGDGIP